MIREQNRGALFAGQHIVLHLRDGSLVERRVEEVGDAFISGYKSAYCIDLILHKSDERGNDDRRTLHHKGRQLVAHRFAASGRHEHKGIATRRQMVYDLLLAWLE